MAPMAEDADTEIKRGDDKQLLPTRETSGDALVRVPAHEADAVRHHVRAGEGGQVEAPAEPRMRAHQHLGGGGQVWRSSLASWRASCRCPSATCP
eukprot:2421269-Prymnesium_polylepis.1